MQLSELLVSGLFGKYDHRVVFPTSSEDEATPSVVILHGPNGIGKTTILRMLNGMMELNFQTFRSVPTRSAQLNFNSGESLRVRVLDQGVIEVEFSGQKALLHPTNSGPWRDEDAESVDRLRETFQMATRSLQMEYVGANRLPSGSSEPDVSLLDKRNLSATVRSIRAREWDHLRGQLVREGEPRVPEAVLAQSVKRFIAEAQLDSQTFFTSNQPDVFERVINDLVSPAKPPMQLGQIMETLTDVHELEATHTRLGLGRDRWDFERLMALLTDAQSPLDERALAVVGTYAEFLDSRARARQLIAERLITFEGILDDFLRDKSVRVDARHGLTMTGTDGNKLEENQLSSGEHHLLYLMVAAVTTRRRGTIIAIDEPELSMHIAWQRKLVPSLVRCASRAAPQLVLATHSPEIAKGYPESMIELGAFGGN